MPYLAMKKIIQLMFFLLLSSLLLRAESPASDFIWGWDGSRVTISGYVGVADDVSIPASISGLPVVTIEFDAFDSCASAYATHRKIEPRNGS